MRLTDLASRLDDRLDTDAYADLDASANGLQVAPDEAQVEHVGFAVDAAVETIEAAAEAGVDALVTHHGLVWGGLDRVTGTNHRRLAPLFEHDLPLYVSHLPLDGHQTLGNAAGLADLLGLVDRDPFGTLGGQYVGQRGDVPGGRSLSDLAVELDRELDTGTRGVQVLEFGPDRVESVAMVTGSGVDWLEEAAASDVDAFVTGEGKQKAYHLARELGLNVVLAGHYATETFGVRALKSLVEEWGLETTYVDHPTGL